MVTKNKIKVVTVAKVGSTTLSTSLGVGHTHSLMALRKIVDTQKDCYIITGVRNPVDRNLSYLFQTYGDNFHNQVMTKKNNYKGEHCYIPSMNIKTEPSKVIDLYFKQTYHNTFNEWFEEFFEITEINDAVFDKDKGLTVYHLKNNNTLIVYTLEKLNNNIKEICEILNVPTIRNDNIGKNKHYRRLYEQVKKQISYKKEYIDNLLDTDIMKFFYTDADIENMYSKYTILVN